MELSRKRVLVAVETSAIAAIPDVPLAVRIEVILMPGRNVPPRSLLADGSVVRFFQLKDGQLGIEIEVKKMRIVDRKPQPTKVQIA